jgi:enoyl-[acyl-carrier-protein] reductase (NADH)
MESLKGKKGLIVGIANEHSIAWRFTSDPPQTCGDQHNTKEVHHG